MDASGCAWGAELWACAVRLVALACCARWLALRVTAAEIIATLSLLGRATMTFRPDRRGGGGKQQQQQQPPDEVRRRTVHVWQAPPVVRGLRSPGRWRPGGGVASPWGGLGAAAGRAVAS